MRVATIMRSAWTKVMGVVLLALVSGCDTKDATVETERSAKLTPACGRRDRDRALDVQGISDGADWIDDDDTPDDPSCDDDHEQPHVGAGRDHGGHGDHDDDDDDDIVETGEGDGEGGESQ